MSQRSKTLAILLASLPAIVPTTVVGQLQAGDRFPLQSEILQYINALGGQSSQWGVLAVSLESGDTLVAVNPGASLAPASNQKLFTTAAALDRLGLGFRFPTYLLTDGVVRDGVLEGDLVLYGTGDPGLSDRFFDSPTDPLRSFARQLVASGIHTVSGDVVGDGTYFRGPSRRDSWGGLDNWYAAPVSALTLQENVVRLRIQPGAGGGAGPCPHDPGRRRTGHREHEPHRGRESAPAARGDEGRSGRPDRGSGRDGGRPR